MYKNKMLNKFKNPTYTGLLQSLLAVLLLTFGAATQADPVDYYEPHLTLSTPVGTLEYGRSLHKGGWAYGYDFFNKPFENSLLKAEFRVTKINNSTDLRVEVDLSTDGKGIVTRTHLVKCYFTANRQNDLYQAQDIHCDNRQSASQYLPAKGHRHLGLAATDAQLKQGVANAFRAYSAEVQAQLPIISSTLPTKFILYGVQEYIPVRIYDAETGLAYHYDTQIRALQKQQSETIFIEWSSASDVASLLVPERITDANGQALLIFENITVNNNGIISRLPLNVTDYQGRRVQYQYDSDRLIKRIDPMGHEWVYQYQDYRPENAPAVALKRLNTIKDPEGHITKFHYEPATALISGFDLPAGGGFKREISMRTNEFGQKEKIESKVFQSGRREDKVYIYGEPLEVTLDASSSAIVEQGNLLEPKTYDALPKIRWIYVSYGAKPASISMKVFYESYGSSNIGGATVQLGFANDEVVEEGNDSTRMLDRVLVNGEVIYSTKKKFTNQTGTHIVITETEDLVSGKSTTSQFLQNFAKGSRPNSVTIIEREGFAKETLYYDAAGYLMSRRNGDVEHHYTRDQWGQVIAYKVTDNNLVVRDIRSQYDDAGNMLQTSWFSAQGDVLHKTLYQYDNYQRLIKVTNALNNSEEYSDFHISGQSQHYKNANGHIYQFSYDLNGNLQSETDPLGQVTFIHNNKVGFPIRYVMPDGSQYNYELDGNGNPIAIIDELGIRSEFAYDNGERLTAYIVPNDDGSSMRQWRTQYNEYDLPTRAISPNNEVTEYRYRLSQLQSVVWPNQSQINYRYQKNGLLLQAQWSGFNGESRTHYFEYDDFGRPIRNLDTNVNSKQMVYDGLDQLIEHRLADGSSIKLQWNEAGQQTQVIDGENNLYRWIYDIAGQVTKTIYPDGSLVQYEYTAAGELAKQVKPSGQIISYVRDSLSRTTHINYFDSETAFVSNLSSLTINLVYNSRNWLTQISNGQTVVQYTYNMRGDLTQVVTHYGPFSKTQQYTYHPDGKLKSYTTPEGITYQYGYNRNNVLETVRIPDVGQLVYTDFEWNKPSRLIYPGGSQNVETFNAFQQPTYVVLNNALQQRIHDARYGYDAEGYLQSIEEADRIQSINYDSNYRLSAYESRHINADQRNIEHQYQYDAVDNRSAFNKTQGADVQRQQWLYEHNRLIEAAGNIYEYDVNGFPIRIADKDTNATLKTFTYNAQQRLSQFSQNGVTTTYSYDPTGEFRLSKSNTNGTTYYLYNQNGLAAEYDSAGNLQVEYQFSPQAGWGIQPMFTRQDGQYYYYQLDYRNAPIRIIDGGGNIHWQAEFDDFGNAIISKPEFSSIESNLRLPGQYADAESGYYYNLNRYYAPQLGRYLTPDPLGLDGGINHYSYANQSSYQYIDPTGEFGWIGAGVGIISGYAMAKAMGCEYGFGDFLKDGLIGAVTGGAGKAVQKSGQVRRAYNKSLRDKLKENPTPKDAYNYRREKGKELKEQTPRIFREMIYKRNERKYGGKVNSKGEPVGDKYGPFFDPDKHTDPKIILTDTNPWVNAAQHIPNKGMEHGGGALGGAASSALGGCNCD